MSSRWVTEASAAFVASLQEFCQGFDDGELSVEHLSELCAGLKHSICVGTQRAIQVYLEDHDEEAHEVDVAGVRYWKKGKSYREVMSPFGKLGFERNVYQGSFGGQTVAPVDIRCGIAGEYGTAEVREAAVLLASSTVYQECVAILEKVSLFSLSLRGLENMVGRTGAFVEQHRLQLQEDVRAQLAVPDGTRVLVASMDGVNVRLDEPGEKRGRPGKRPGVATGSQKTCHKNAMVGSFSFYGEALDPEKCPQRLAVRYIARMPEDEAPVFKQEFERTLHDIERDLNGHAIRKVLLMDGQRSFWTYAEDNPLYEDYEFLVDFYHSSEHLSKAAECIWGASTAMASEWYDRYVHVLKGEDSGPRAVIRSIRYYLRTRKLSNSRREDLETELGFFVRNQHRMNYALFRRQGIPIGSGPVEAACKTLVKVRFDRAGARWSRVRGQHILTPRAFAKAGQWNLFWKGVLDLQQQQAPAIAAAA